MKHILLKISLVVMLVLLSCRALNANICIEIDLPPHPEYQFEDNLFVESFDGAQIAANLFVPTSPAPASGYPTIIFVNSWVVDEHEYMLQAAQFAKKGYLVFSYSARGWGCSEGMVNVVGDKDMLDLTAIVDWLIATQPVDNLNIGISGISYGSGISLMGLAKEPRLKTAVAMSTWGSLTDSLFQNQTPRLFWGFFLVSSGILTANMDPIIAQNYFDLVVNQNIDSVTAWAELRSVSNYVDLINQRNAPVYLANNFGDNLFQPNNLLKFYQNITSPKRLDLNQGTHATGEGFGLVGLNNYTWNNTHLWFDYWLKGEENGILNQHPVTMLTESPSSSDYYRRDEYSDWPIPEANETQFYFGARGIWSNGSLESMPYHPGSSRSNRIYSGLDTFASTGIPVLSALLDGHLRAPVKTYLPLISRLNGIVFESEKLANGLKIRGIPKIKLNIKPSYSKMQLNAYLYDVSGNTGTLITHGPMTLHQAVAGDTIEASWEMVATAYDIAPGNKLAIAFDTFDILYGVPTILPYAVDFKFSAAAQSELSLPTVH